MLISIQVSINALFTDWKRLEKRKLINTNN